MIVIVTNELDLHADAVISALRESGVTDIARLDLETAHRRFDMIFSPRENDFHIWDRFGRNIRRETITTVWWRRATTETDSSYLELPSEKLLDQVETYWALRWAFEALPAEMYPLSHPLRMREAANKLLQLCVAAEVGLKTPDSLFSNANAALTSFTDDKSVVVKPLRSTVVRSEESGRLHGLVTRPISAMTIRPFLKEDTKISAFLQERVHKIADIRVNVFPAVTLGCRIDTSALNKDEEVDWRPTTMSHSHDEIEVPDQIDTACRKLLARFDLKWGAFDFGLTDQGEWVFFECNSNGQWLWIEVKTGMPLANVVASELRAHHLLRRPA